MVIHGTIRGNKIEIDGPLPWPDGQSVRVSIEPVSTKAGARPVDRLLAALRSTPASNSADVDEMLRAIEAGKMPLSKPPSLNEAA